jgi:hypothetical protein
MDYSAIYKRIILNRNANPYNGYVEEHHVLPRCLGGTDEKDNLVKLTAKEHFICHLLLTRMCINESLEYYKLVHAFMMMKNASHNNKRYISGHEYAKLRVAHSIRMSSLTRGSNNSQYGTQWIYNPVLKESKKIQKDLILEDGWYRGRVTDWESHYTQRICLVCGATGCMSKMTSYCSKECKAFSTNPFSNRETEFYTLYNQQGSMNKALKCMGFPGAVSHWYRYAYILLSKRIL